MFLTSSFVDSPASVAELLNSLNKPPITQTSVFIGTKTGYRDGKETISILQLLVHPQKHVYLIDVYALGEATFNVEGTNGWTLGKILGSATFPKAIFNVNRCAGLLYADFGIDLQGIQDIGLMEWIAHPGPLSEPKGLFRKRLDGCIKKDVLIFPWEKRKWQAIHEAGKRLYSPAEGGSSQVFFSRPLHEDVRAYCVHRLQYLPTLHKLYWKRILDLGRAQIVADETRHVVQYSQRDSSQLRLLEPGWYTNWQPRRREAHSFHSQVRNQTQPHLHEPKKLISYYYVVPMVRRAKHRGSFRTVEPGDWMRLIPPLPRPFNIRKIV